MDNNIYFEKLTLNEDVDIKVYEEALNFAFESSDIKNIAISGAYGAGKSSVLASYKKTHKDKNFMHISLAHFKEEETLANPDNPPKVNSDDSQTKNNNDDKHITKNNIKESILEGKILNQLIHQLSLDDVPQTNFKIKQNVKKSTIVLNTVFIVLFIANILFIKFHNQWVEYVDTLSDWLSGLLKITQFHGILLVSVAILSALSVVFVYELVKVQKNKRFLKKLNLQGNEIEIFEDKDESYFDKYLNEVLYLFENCKMDAIVFEDMDRFEMNHIFERLREINTLANVQLSKREDGKVLRFFYLLRDDVFVSKDRTKFFDYIIPIVPVMDGTNSYDQFISHLEKNDMLGKLNEKFLQGLSLYVDDMRLLKNICNEFLIYYNRVNTTELDCNKMLALITYKNLFPRDFSELQLGRGFIHSLFAQKEIFIGLEVSELKQLIEERKQEIKRCDNEQLTSLEELDLINSDKKNKADRANTYALRQQMQQKYQEWVKEEYPKRKKAIEDKVRNNRENIQKEIDDLNFKCIKIQSCPLNDLITRENIDSIFKNTSTTNEIEQVEEYKEIKGSECFDILKYLIRNGYIDETYSDYMTYFYENSLSRVDKIFLRSVTDKKAKEYSYELKNPELVISRLDVYDFEEKETLNFHLLKYLFENKPDYIQLKTILKQISQNNNLDFMRQFLNYFDEFDFCVAKINELWPQFFKQMLENGLFDTQLIHKYSICTLHNSSLDDISNVNINNCLKKYIEDCPGYLNIANPKVSKLILAFQHLSIKFKVIDFTVSDKELFREIYKQSLYELNFRNIKLMLTIMVNFANEEEIIHQNYSLILNAEGTPLNVYVNSNIEQYAQDMLDNCEERIDDVDDVAIAFINNTNISQELKCKYIEFLNTTIDSLSLIEDTSLWEYCLDKGIIEFTEKNIVLYYFAKEEFDLSLVNYINSFPDNINMKKVNIEDNDKISQLFNACVKCIDINNEKYKQFLTSMHRVYYSNFSIQNIPNDKMQILIDERIIRFTTDSLASLRENYDADICYHYIKKNFDAYIENMTTEFFSFEELIEILEWDVSDVQKIELLNFTSKPISIVNKSYSVNIKIHILQNNLCDEDITYLRENYDIQEKQIRDFVLENAVDNINAIITNSNPISYMLLCDLFKSGDVAENKKISLLITIIPVIEKEQCRNIFNLLERSDLASIFEPRKKPKFLIEKTNLQVLEAMKKKGWIYEYYTDNDKEYYRIRRNKPLPQKIK